jgi:hypothetical protein
MCQTENIESFCRYIDISNKEFWDVIDKNVNMKLFKPTGNKGEYIPRFKVGDGLND